MRTKTDIDTKNTQSAHQSKMKRLHSHHQNEIDKVKNEHVRQKNDIKAKHLDQIHLQKVNHDHKLQTKTIQNEKTYNKLQQNLDDVKERLSKTKADLERQNENELKSQKMLHDVKLEQRHQDNSLKLADATQATQIELNRIQRRIQSDKQSLASQNNEEKSLQISSHKNETELKKQTYQKEHASLENANARALFKMRVNHERIKADEERKNSKEINQRRSISSSEIAKIDADSALKKKSKQEHFEADYKVLRDEHETLINTLMTNKEKIIKEFTDELTNKFSVGAAKHEDDFYKFGTLDVQIQETEAKDGYDIYIPIKEHEAKNIKLVGEKRQLRLTMEREYSNTLNEEHGTDRMSKIETYTAKRFVADIIDPASLTKDYKNGKLHFRILKA